MELKRGASVTHQMMIEWELQNPGGTLRQMSAFFGGYSISWLSQIRNTDMYKAMLSERMKDVKERVSNDIPAKLRALAELSIERMTEVVENASDPEVLVDSFDKVMHRYGYAPNAKNGAQNQTAIGQQNNVFFLNKEDFQRVQGKLINSHAQKSQEVPSLPPALEQEV